MREALNDERLFGSVLVGPTWDPWRVLLIGALGEPLLRTERWTFEKLTGRSIEPGQPVEELWCVVGRRGGKSRAMSVLASYIAGLVDHADVLAPGETGVLLCIAPDQKQSSIVLNYIEATLERSPILRPLLASRTADTIDLTNRVSIQVRASNFRHLRGPTFIGVIADEAAFWRSDESANPDTEILNSVRPGMSTTNGMLAVLSSPYARRGELWGAFKKHYGPGGDKLVLVAQGESRTFNPSLSEKIVARAYEKDPIAAAAEYGAQFRSDIESFVTIEAVLACVTPNARERPPVDGNFYAAFIDPAGGSGKDSFTLAVAHLADEQRAILDALREVRPPFSPEAVVDEFASVLRSYGISSVRGDHYAGEWPAEQFRKRGIDYLPADRPKSDLYRDLLPVINSQRVDLLDVQKLIAQLTSLERRTARSGKDSIDHPAGAHDDLANVVAGVVATALAEHQFADGIPVAPKFFTDHREPTWGDAL